MKILLFFFAVSMIALGRAQQPATFGCDPCDSEVCPTIDNPQRDCPAGLVPDTCGCCRVCARTVGQKCYSPSLPVTSRQYGYCGENLDCIVRSDLMRKDEPEAICVCKQEGEVCASNNHTYETKCHMALEAAKLPNPNSLFLRHMGPCHTVPIITSGPEDAMGILGQPIALSCEVKGYPIPDIHWEFQDENEKYSTLGKNLPSDDLYVAVQVRGGPEPFMTTSWVQIVDLRKTDIGKYTCVAVNTKGVVRASANIRIY